MADDLKTLFDKLQEIKEKELKFEKDRADETFKEKVKEDKALKKLNAESRKITADSLRALRDSKKQEKVIQERIDELQKTRDTDKEKYDKTETAFLKWSIQQDLKINEAKIKESKTELKELKDQSKPRKNSHP